MEAPAQQAATEEAEEEEPPVKKKAAPRLLLDLENRELTAEQKWQKQQMLVLAKMLGYACVNIQGVQRDFAQQIFARMTNRLGKAVYQTISFTMSMPRSALEQILPLELATHNSATVIDWEAKSLEEVRTMMGCTNLLSSISNAAAGLTRAVQPPSESVARVFSTLMPTVEISHSILPYGAERVTFNAQYVLFDNSAECHKPKDQSRRELSLPEGLEPQLRQQVLQDVLQISEQIPISAAWWRQLGQEDRALEVEAGIVTTLQRQRAAQRALALAAREPVYEVEEILREVKTAGAARSWLLVRWNGYDPTWEAWRISGEVGSPICTWEPLRSVARTEAYSRWRESQRQPLPAPAP